MNRLLAIICGLVLCGTAWAQDAAKTTAADAAKAAMKEAVPETSANPFKWPWKSSLDFGLGGARGNKNSTDLRLAFGSAAETKRDRTKVDLSYNYGSTDGDDTRNDLTTGIIQDWLIQESPWFTFAEARYDYDQFGSWSNRYSGRGGVGYEFIKRDDLEIIGRLGAGAYEAIWDHQPTRFEGSIGGEGAWKFAKGFELAGKSTYYPGLSLVTPGYPWRWVSSAYVKMALEAKNMNIKVGFEHEYQAEVVSGRRHNDVKFFATIGVTF